jgi:Uma2 family endonuclease
MENTARSIQKYTVEEYYKKVENYSTLTELRNGEIVDLASPSIRHQTLTGELSYTFREYIKRNKGKCKVFEAPTDVKLDESNVVIPDVFIACNPENFDSQKYNGAPDYIAEVVSTNWADDYIRKLHLYQESGVREYWIVDPKKGTVTVFFFEEQFNENYSFNDDIPVNIYKHNVEPLRINVSRLLDE